MEGKSSRRTKPFVRWWWFGCAVTEEEIARELEEMSKVGIGGVEIQPIYPLVCDDPDKGIINIPYLSDRWLELLSFTIEKARKLGIVVDITCGSGWPFGGPCIPKVLSAGRLKVHIEEVSGPTEYNKDLSSILEPEERIIAILINRVSEKEFINLYNYISDNKLIYHLPQGRWRLLVFIDSYTGQYVKRPAVGAEGLVLNHFDREALDLYLKEVGDKLVSSVELGDRGKTVQCLFCDSWEVFGSNWCHNFPEEFKKRKGYDIVDYLPALFEDIGEITPFIRYDYHSVLSELAIENFFSRFTEWCHSKGLFARIQAHGTPADVLKAYGVADIPEGESWIGGDKWLVRTSTRKLASSAAHIYGKKICSAEAYTWLRKPRFMETLEQMKLATDVLFLEGINHIVGHGYPYSPPSAGIPGWVFYASSLINHNQTWWEYIPYLNRYIERTSRILQEGQFCADILVYAPYHDIWSDGILEELNLSRALDRKVCEVVNLIREAGYDFDFINDDIFINKTRYEDGKLKIGELSYSILLLPKMKYIPFKVLEKIRDFARNGLKVIAVEVIPEYPAGLMEFKELFEDFKMLREEVSRLFVLTTLNNLKEVLHSLLTPDIKIDPEDKSIPFIHLKNSRYDIYLVANMSGEKKRFNIGFRGMKTIPIEYDIEREIYTQIPYFSFTPEGIQIPLQLGPCESRIFMFDRYSNEGPIIRYTNLEGLKVIEKGEKVVLEGLADREGEYFIETKESKKITTKVDNFLNTIVIKPPWVIHFRDKNGEEYSIEKEHLSSWTEWNELKYFSGKVKYVNRFYLNEEYCKSDTRLILSLGKVYEVAEVMINGQQVGVLWKGERSIDITPYVVFGENLLEIFVTNLLINYVISQPEEDYSQLIATYGERFPKPEEKTEIKEPLPSGLIGPVEVRALKVVRFTL
jgi:hypothetical protein